MRLERLENKPLIIGVLTSFSLSFLDERIAIVSGLVGFFVLSIVQLSLLSKSGKWAIIGGKPTQKLEGGRKYASLAAVGILFGVLSWLVIKIVWLKIAS